MSRPKRGDILASWRRFLPPFRQGETLREAKANLLDALKLVLECQRELAERELSPNALREPIEFAEA